MTSSAKRRPLNEQTIVFYHSGGYSHLFREYVSTWDIRGACTEDGCTYLDEHWTYDGQIFYQKKEA